MSDRTRGFWTIAGILAVLLIVTLIALILFAAYPDQGQESSPFNLTDRASSLARAAGRQEGP